MKKLMLIVLLGITLATAMGGCKKGGWANVQSCAHVVLIEKRITQETPPESPPDTINAIACELSISKGCTASLGNKSTLPAKL